MGLGKMIASGRLAKLEGELALQKNLTEEMKKNQQEMDEFMAELDEDVEGMQSTIYYLQQQLREARETITKECDQLKKAAEEAQNELAAWKFTPDSATGKRLMAKCRQLYQENEDLGKMIASGRLAKLEGELALQKNLTEEMK